MPRITCPPAWLLILVSLTGCGEELGPEKMETTSIRGRLTAHGQPVGPAWLEAMPIEGTVGLLRTAPVDAQGRFHADRFPVGRVGFRIVGLKTIPISDSLLAAYVQQARQSYVIHRLIEPGKPVDIDLRVEALKAVEKQLHQ